MATKIKAEKGGYKLVAAGRGIYWIETDENQHAGHVKFSGGKFHASRSAGLTFHYATATARTAIEAFEAVLKPTWQEIFHAECDRIERLNKCVFMSTAEHCLAGGAENADMTPEVEPRSEEWYALTMSGYWSNMDDCGQYGDLRYTTNIERDIEDGKIERY